MGQSHDLTWTRNLECPAEKEYLEMVDKSEFDLAKVEMRLDGPDWKYRNGRSLSHAGEDVGRDVKLAH